ncbi:MAG: transcription-repair coupling factor [Ruminococcaceae bacterium]|nr:transcription-repair coupling factor [Oscillospiraceae bacterium]
MRIVTETIQKDKDFAALLRSVSAGELPALVNGVCDNALPAFVSAVAAQAKKKPFVLVGDEKQAITLQKQLSAYMNKVLFYPARGILYDTVETYSREWEQTRVSVLYSMLTDDYDALITVPDALMQYTVSPETLINCVITLKQGDRADLRKLCEQLTLMGYSRAEFVEGAGQFSLRGGILDIFSSGEDSPVRIDFFDDEVDLIGHFDVLSQRRTDNIDFVTVLPVTENIFSSHKLGRVIEYIEKKLSSSELSAANAVTLNKEREAAIADGVVLCPDKYRKILFDENATLADYADGALVVIIDSKRVSERARVYYWEQCQMLERLTDSGTGDFDTAQCCMSDKELKAFTARNCIVFDAFTATGTSVEYKSYANIITKHNSTASLSVEMLAEEFSALLAAGQKVLYIARNEQGVKNAIAVLAEKGIEAYEFKDVLCDGKVAITLNTAGDAKGFEIPGAGFALVAEEAAVKKTVKRRSFGEVKGERLSSYADLSIGDYVVHVNHGIGRFEGLYNMVTEGVAKDYIKISYAAGDSLYVPCNQLDSVSKFIGNTETVKVHRLGGTEWHRAKSRAKAAAKNIAKELLKLYSARRQSIGFSCYPDDELQEEFEAMFEYPETEGQLVAAKEIKADMESTIPMERLLCGDVGFGKTEVALRAVFKAVNSGKQVAVLVPTTLLAWQHYQTMKSRFKGFPVNVSMLSSLNDKRINDSIITELKQGRTDVVVGTHRILQKDIGFKDLGLLVIDEEQRFGVTHKERIKTLASGIHTLTLSATPIPRTLNMALSGIRDMSVLEDAPSDRLPVQSYVLEYDEEIINEAISRELRRGGQVFYLINNTEVMYAKAAVLSERFPDKVISVGHGQMDKEKLSKIWESMVKGETDVLICTTIIETGIDVPNANTLIIEDADRMGLSQLHQIRGRVGRSSRRAYAYFTYRPGRLLTEIAQKRLQAIREYTEFGSGFKIAMRDLEIRGAGNLLGAEQHGHIESIGYDLYVKLLKEAVDEEKGIVTPVEKDCSVDVSVNAYIPEDYIESSAVRIDMYRKIAFIQNDADAEDLVDELCDRFGEPPAPVSNLITVAMCRRKAAELGFTAVEQKEKLLSMYNDNIDIKACSVLSAINDFRGRIMLSAGTKPHISCRLKMGEGVLSTLSHLLDAYGKLQ